MVLLAAASCGAAALLTLEQAEKLILAIPNIEAAVRDRGAKPFFEYIEQGPDGWRFDVNSNSPCENGSSCSTLPGHFVINKSSGQVIDLDAGEVWHRSAV